MTARALVLAECWGVSSHGLMRLPSYLTRLGAGGFPPDAELTTVRDLGALVVLDGGGGLGHWQAWSRRPDGAERCREHGLVGGGGVELRPLRRSGIYTLPASSTGLLALVLSHGPAAMPPWGGDRPLLSTSPLAVGIPCSPRPAIVDLATSLVARGTIAEHAARGEPIPGHWAFYADGSPTTDAAVALAGMLAPLGGAKGFALAFAVEALTAGSIGPRLSGDVPDPFSVPLAAGAAADGPPGDHARPRPAASDGEAGAPRPARRPGGAGRRPPAGGCRERHVGVRRRSTTTRSCRWPRPPRALLRDWAVRLDVAPVPAG